jgi:hypothetical protein
MDILKPIQAEGQAQGDQALAQATSVPDGQVQKQQLDQQPQPNPEPTQDDLLKRVGEFQKENPPDANLDHSQTQGFGLSDIEKIEDPVAREAALNAYKSLEKGYNQKFQALAEQRKALESQGQNSNNQTLNRQWTPEEVQKLANDPSFVQAAQQVYGTQADPNAQVSSDEYSALTDVEKAKMAAYDQKIAMLEKQLVSASNRQQHETLQSKYPDYNPQAIDTIKADLIAGKVQATNEHLYKAFNYEKNVQNAYEMGLQEGLKGTSERRQYASPEGQIAVASTPPVEKMEGESSKAFWKRIASGVLNKTSQQNPIKT